ncbi:Hypothetical protein I5071_85130 [Sandaracinus amylolyticus]|nr:Hypothetical protein I5071_85130 [Sandaracinus amylolyticus]
MLLAALATTPTACGRVGYDSQGRLDAAVVQDAGTSSEPDASCARALDPCTELPRLDAPPSIDGALEPCLALSVIEPRGWNGLEPLPDGITARAAIAWHPDGLYAYVEVDDGERHAASPPDRAHCGDAIEVFVDDDGALTAPPDYDRPGTAQFVVAAPLATRGPYAQRWVIDLIGDWTSPRFLMVERPSGYALEALIVAEDLGLASWALVPGARLGVALSIDVSPPGGPREGECGGRLGQFFSRVISEPGGCGEPYCDARALCTPVLR